MKKGFTLIELLVAVVIIGVLATIGTIQYIRSAEKSKLSEALMVMNSVAKTEQHHYFAKDKYTKRFADLSLDFMDKTGAMVQNDIMDTNNYKMTLESNRVRSERTTGDYTLFEYYGDEKITCTPKDYFICANYPEETNTSGESTEEPEEESQRSLEPYCSDYNSNGLCTKIREYNEDGGYTEKSDCASIVDNICVNPDTEKNYDKDGNMLSETYCKSSGYCYEQMKYTYDENGNQTSQTYHDISGSCLQKNVYAYDGNGNMISHKHYKLGGDFTGEYKYVYDTNGNQTSQTYCNSSGSCRVEHEYAYDENGNMTLKKKYDYTKGTIYIYEYDEDGNVVNALKDLM